MKLRKFLKSTKKNTNYFSHFHLFYRTEKVTTKKKTNKHIQYLKAGFLKLLHLRQATFLLIKCRGCFVFKQSCVQPSSRNSEACFVFSHTTNPRDIKNEATDLLTSSKTSRTAAPQGSSSGSIPPPGTIHWSGCRLLLTSRTWRKQKICWLTTMH